VTLLRRRLDEASDASFERSVSEGRAQHVRSGSTPRRCRRMLAHGGGAGGDNERQDAALAARIEVADRNVAGLDRRLGQIDTAIEEAAKRGKTNTALSAMEGQRRTRAGLASERNEAAGTLATIKAGRASLAAQVRRIETEAAPIRYVAELVGADRMKQRSSSRGSGRGGVAGGGASAGASSSTVSLYRVGQGHRARFRRRGRLVYRSRMSCRRDVRSQGTNAWNVRKRRRPCKTASGPL
jgi:hypothetical protein